MLTALAEDGVSVPSTHMVAHKPPVISVSGGPHILFCLKKHDMYMYSCRLTFVKIKT